MLDDVEATIAAAQRTVEQRAERERERGRNRRRSTGRDKRTAADRAEYQRNRPPRPKRKRKAIGTFLPLAPGRGDQPVAIIHAQQDKGLSVVRSNAGPVEVHKPAQVRRLLTELAEGHYVTYCCPSLRSVIASDKYRAGWELHKWNGKWSKAVTPEHLVIRRISPFGLECDAETATEALGFWEAVDVAPAAMVSMGRAWWRTTLAAPVTLYGPPAAAQPIVHEYNFPARQGGWAGTWSDMAYDDISAAYPHALAQAPFWSHLAVSDSPGVDPVAAEATVHIAPGYPRREGQWYPLPMAMPLQYEAKAYQPQRATCYGWGDVRGWWSARELAMVEELPGCHVTYHRWLAGVGRRVAPFGAWLDAALTLRAELAPAARAVAKVVSNTTWAIFGMHQAITEVEFFHGGAQKYQGETTRSERTPATACLLHVAAEVHARVRERMWREQLVGQQAVYVDTDGVIGPASAPRLPGWSRKHAMAQVSIGLMQWYRWTEPKGGGWRYCAAGAAPDDPGMDQAWERLAPSHFAPGAPLDASGAFSGQTLPPQGVWTAQSW